MRVERRVQIRMWSRTIARLAAEFGPGSGDGDRRTWALPAASGLTVRVCLEEAGPGVHASLRAGHRDISVRVHSPAQIDALVARINELVGR